MKILILGGTGLVGSHLVSEAVRSGHAVAATFHDASPPPSPEGRDWFPLDIDSGAEDGLDSLLQKTQPEAVINATGWTWVDGCEKDPARADRLNHLFPKRLAQCLEPTRTRLVHFSSSYVFDGLAGPYSEDTPPGPINVYGHSKRAGETALLDGLPDRSLILRTIVVYGAELRKKNFVYQVLDKLRRGRPLEIPADQEGNPTEASDLARATLALLSANCAGIWNVAGPEASMNRLEFATLIAQTAGLPDSLLIPRTTAALAQPARRPLRGGLLTDKLCRQVGPLMRPAREALSKLIPRLEPPAV
ncbi:MAG: SDR family oxidoreductase [Verrucomicrobiae bacterium]|nr:SDR family oxidoreductase [Verrucomicrobiae bacterium]